MTSLRIFVGLSVAALASACASPGTMHASHHADASASAPMAAMEPRMKAMQEMHKKMMNAKTPEERSALMADHMKAMQDGMSMMKNMPGMGAMADPKGMPIDMAVHHKKMAQHMEMMQMMMEMMMDRLPPSPAKP